MSVYNVLHANFGACFAWAHMRSIIIVSDTCHMTHTLVGVAGIIEFLFSISPNLINTSAATQFIDAPNPIFYTLGDF